MPRDLPWRKWMPLLVLAACALVWLSILLPGVMRARDDARRTTSKRNLEILGAAFHSYHEVHQVFPPGSIIASDDTAMHVWETMLLPHFDSARTFGYIDFDYAWNDPVNEHLFRTQNSYFLNPVVIPRNTTAGYFLSHYSANPAIFHRNSSVSIRDLFDTDAGTAHDTWMAAEVFDDWQPWGAPYHWRDLNWPPTQAAGSGGWPEGGAHILRFDGSVQFYDAEADAGPIEQLRKQSPHVEASLTEKPNVRWDYSGSAWDRSYLELDVKGIETIRVTAEIKPDGSIRTVHIPPSIKYLDETTSESIVQKTVAEFPQVEIFLTHATLDDKMLQVILKLPRLEVLRVDEILLSADGLQQLAKLKSLKILEGSASEAMASRLKELLPDCELRLTILKPAEEAQKRTGEHAGEELPDARE